MLLASALLVVAFSVVVSLGRSRRQGGLGVQAVGAASCLQSVAGLNFHDDIYKM